MTDILMPVTYRADSAPEWHTPHAASFAPDGCGLISFFSVFVCSVLSVPLW